MYTSTPNTKDGGESPRRAKGVRFVDTPRLVDRLRPVPTDWHPSHWSGW